LKYFQKKNNNIYEAVNIYILEKYNKLKGLYKKIMSQIACRELLNENFKIVVLAFRI
jgi:hypothetical protein